MTRGFWAFVAGIGLVASVAFGQWAGICGWLLVGGLATQLPKAE